MKNFGTKTVFSLLTLILFLGCSLPLEREEGETGINYPDWFQTGEYVFDVIPGYTQDPYSILLTFNDDSFVFDKIYAGTSMMADKEDITFSSGEGYFTLAFDYTICETPIPSEVKVSRKDEYGKVDILFVLHLEKSDVNIVREPFILR